MPSTALNSSRSIDGSDPAIRQITSADLRSALRDGWEDFNAMRGDLIFVMPLYPLLGIIAATAIAGGPLLPLLFPILAGVGLLGPVAAVGFYELGRRRERGLESGWSHFLDVARRPSADDIAAVAALLLAIFAAWLVAAGAIYVALWGWHAPESVGSFLTRLFTTPEGWALIVVGNLVGLGFAALVLAVSVVSLPMLVDRDISAGEAVRTSVQAVRENPGTMARWGVIVAALLIAGSIPLFIGLAFVLPWLGYSTWHLYGRLIERPAN